MSGAMGRWGEVVIGDFVVNSDREKMSSMIPES